MDAIMNISLTPELEEYVAAQLESGHYRSSSEVVREALRNQIRQSMSHQLEQRLSASRQQVAEGRVVRADAAYFDEKREKTGQTHLGKEPSE